MMVICFVGVLDSTERGIEESWGGSHKPTVVMVSMAGLKDRSPREELGQTLRLKVRMKGQCLGDLMSQSTGARQIRVSSRTMMLQEGTRKTQ